MLIETRKAEPVVNVLYWGFLTAGVLLPLLKAGKKDRVRGMRALETLGAGYLLSQGLKKTIPARRPRNLNQESFPSGHVLHSVSIAATTGVFYRRQTPWWFAGATL